MLPAITPILADISWTVTFLAIGFVAISLFMMLVILIQKPKGGGLSGAFGGAGGGESSFVGAKIGDFLTYLTVGCFVMFLVLAMLLTWNINPAENQAKAATVSQQSSDTAGEEAAPTSDTTAGDIEGEAGAADTTLDGGEAISETAEEEVEAALTDSAEDTTPPTE